MSCILEIPETAVNSIIARFTPSRENLIPILHDVQEMEGYLAPASIAQVAAYLGLSESEVYGVATFYTRFRFKPAGKHCLKVCCGTACHVKGSGEVFAELEKKLGIKAGETTSDGVYSLETVACFGSCALAPIVVADGRVSGRVAPADVDELLWGDS